MTTRSKTVNKTSKQWNNVLIIHTWIKKFFCVQQKYFNSKKLINSTHLICILVRLKKSEYILIKKHHLDVTIKYIFDYFCIFSWSKNHFLQCRNPASFSLSSFLSMVTSKSSLYWQADQACWVIKHICFSFTSGYWSISWIFCTLRGAVRKQLTHILRPPLRPQKAFKSVTIRALLWINTRISESLPEKDINS